MSQQPVEQQEVPAVPDEERHFAEGLDAALTEGEEPQEEALPQEVEDGADQERIVQDDPPYPAGGAEGQEEQEEPAAVTAEPAPEASPSQEETPSGEPAQPAVVEISEELTAEYERLQKMDAEAAAMAREDSPEGEAMRYRLEQYGAEIAHDHARLVRMQRQQADEREVLRQERARQAALERQRNFLRVMQHDHPDFHALLTGSDSAAQMRFRNDMLQWIQAKPYGEAAPLMDIFTRSQDPQEVSSLLTRFKRECEARRPDPTGALAVPGRGGTVAPAGIGDKDDFDAGLSLSLSSKE
ncbi:hypothetical protein [uncultured Desulfovibrio sp.]|uniref:hypothetical protein n=1 Tax=uncultured Desulfovibrio sp. TaxID=167968 RepID=UPI002639AA06|nr:hypothetical protein [uncultured Desulfovibrio sp.]